MHEPGRYHAEIVGQQMAESSNGNPQLILVIRLLGKLDPADPETMHHCPADERRVFMTITQKTIDFVLRDLKALGFSKSSFSFLDPNTDGYHDFRGTEVDVSCQHDTYQGEVKEKWQLALNGGFEAKPLDKKNLRKLDSLFGKKLKDAVGSPSQANPQVDADEVPADDQIPF